MNCPYKDFLRALQGRGTLRVPDIGHEASRPYNRNHRVKTFYKFIKCAFMNLRPLIPTQILTSPGNNGKKNPGACSSTG
jgi:hypothetical protein